MSDRFVVRVPLPGSRGHLDLHNDPNRPSRKGVPFAVNDAARFYFVHFCGGPGAANDYHAPYQPASERWPATQFPTREAAEEHVRHLLAKIRMGHAAGNTWGDFHLQFAEVLTVEEMNADEVVRDELRQAKLAASAEKADEKVEQAKREAEKIRQQLANAPKVPITSKAGGWVAHSDQKGIQKRTTEAGVTTFRKRVTHLGRTLVSPSVATLEEAIGWEPPAEEPTEGEIKRRMQQMTYEQTKALS